MIPFFLEEVTGEASIVHGDWRADNLMVDENGDLVVIDFQLTGTGQISYDLGYFMSQSIEPEVRRTANDAIIERFEHAENGTGHASPFSGVDPRSGIVGVAA